MPSLFQVILLAIVQGLAELLPVSSSAHVVVAEKLLGLDPSTPYMTLLLVMLHTGTMFAVIVYFWNKWAMSYFRTTAIFVASAIRVILASVLTAIIGYPIIWIVEHTVLKGAGKAEIEQLFGRLDLVAAALFCAGLLILVAGLARRRDLAGNVADGRGFDRRQDDSASMTLGQAGAIGAVQGLCLPFRGFSRSGATISTGMLGGVAREAAETFSFALAVVLTPAAIGREVLRVFKFSKDAAAAGTPIDFHGVWFFSILGALFAFGAGLVALKWLSSWLEAGKWHLFGIYCLVASVVVFVLYTRGF
jgi:undecaprenyl-diphosphatase